MKKARKMVRKYSKLFRKVRYKDITFKPSAASILPYINKEYPSFDKYTITLKDELKCKH